MGSPWIRLVLAISLDGRLTLSSGCKATLGGKGDRKVLEEALAWSDATLMGSGTLKAHQNTCLIHNAQLIAQRHQEGRSSQPLSVIVSKKTLFSSKWEFFTQPIERWLLSPKLKPKLLEKKLFDRHFYLKKTWEQTLDTLYNVGCSKIALLGGTSLISSFLLEDKIDELQFTLTPRVLGGKYSWTSAALNDLPNKLSKANSWELKKIEDLGENEVLLSYLRNRS